MLTHTGAENSFKKEMQPPQDHPCNSRSSHFATFKASFFTDSRRSSECASQHLLRGAERRTRPAARGGSRSCSAVAGVPSCLDVACPLALARVQRLAMYAKHASHPSGTHITKYKSQPLSSTCIYLQDTHPDLQANAAGALQSICFQKAGRAAVRGTEAAAQLCALLNTGNPRVMMRAAGALHNVSTDADAIRCIRR